MHGTMPCRAGLAQLVEHPPCKRKVVSSIPTAGTISFASVVLATTDNRASFGYSAVPRRRALLAFRKSPSDDLPQARTATKYCAPSGNRRSQFSAGRAAFNDAGKKTR